MPDEDDDKIEDMAPSAESTLDDKAQDAPAPTGTQVANDADSSPATGENERDLLSVVRNVVDTNRKPAQMAPPAEGDEDEAPGGGPKPRDDEEFSDVPFHKHPRFQQLLRKSKAFEQDAGRYRNVQNFMDQNGLAAEEAADLLIIGGLMKTNPVEAWRRMKPAIQRLLIAAGEVLPDDLRQRVQGGELSQAAALEVSRSRAAQESMEAMRSFEERRRNMEVRNRVVLDVQQAALDWEAERRHKDPNFDAKMPSLMREVTYLQRTEGVPETPEGVREQLRKAYKALAPPPAQPAAQQRPQKKPITPIRGGQGAGGAKPEIRSTMDIVNSVLARRRSA